MASFTSRDGSNAFQEVTKYCLIITPALPNGGAGVFFIIFVEYNEEYQKAF